MHPLLYTGLYGLTPLIADLRGILTRFNWIADVLNLIDSPLENFINANFVPLPQVRVCMCVYVCVRLCAGCHPTGWAWRGRDGA